MYDDEVDELEVLDVHTIQDDVDELVNVVVYHENVFGIHDDENDIELHELMLVEKLDVDEDEIITHNEILELLL